MSALDLIILTLLGIPYAILLWIITVSIIEGSER